MEHTIGNLGQEIWQPSDPFSNLTQQGIHHCQVNVLKAMLPHLDPPENDNPHASADLHNGYVLLAKHDKCLITLQGAEAQIISEYLRSEYQELQKSPDKIHMAQNVKVFLDGRDCITEVQYFTRLIVRAPGNHSNDDDDNNDDLDAPDKLEYDNIALITLYSNPHPHLFKQSYRVVTSCTKQGEPSLQVILVSSIQSVVAMVLHHPIIQGMVKERYFLVEKMGVDIAHLRVKENEED
ncbi:hypothetical protein F5J12DRAFT_894214 [Pisolithus orientalis]|uniref:uncharacterized protein n=1 Tax=Pisolithus orientalis TaxID=936130 RepID=UPI0022243247|nr:uncharacterized protein F5J12DRAFT_894214 [Pisolithus orientalis]KAI6002449.1 hypothetical protein F5J12DRAFT_894214 [Pisolithus orientalis]